jgi:RNA polymerase sigma factor (sigma-70 family)
MVLASGAVGAREEVGMASWERPNQVQDIEPGADPADSDASAYSPPKDALRSWLAKGIHTFGFDARRLGGRGHARQVLGDDHRSGYRGAEAWREWASALQRHTLHSALTRLSAVERQVVTLAYLEGRTNREIAASLGVSVSTVRRRLWLALEHLDESVLRTGRWVSAILLLGAVYVADRSSRLGRFVYTSASSDWPHKLAATVAVGVVGAASVSLVGANHHSVALKHSSLPAIAGLTQPPSSLIKSFIPSGLPLAPSIAAPITPITTARISTSITVPPSVKTHVTKTTKVGSDATDEQSKQGESTSEKHDKGDKDGSGDHAATQSGQHGDVQDSSH